MHQLHGLEVTDRGCCVSRTRMEAERNAVRFENERDAQKYMMGDARERSSQILVWDGEAHTYCSYARRARQYVDGTRKQESYLKARGSPQRESRSGSGGMQARVVAHGGHPAPC